MYKDLLKDTGFPSLYDMVCRDAYVCISQWRKFDPEMFPKPVSSSEIRKYELHKQRNLHLPLRAAQSGLVSEILELARVYEEKTVSEHEEREKRKIRFKNKQHLIDPLPPAVARLNRLKNLATENKWSNMHLRRMIRFESMLEYNCLEPRERLEKFKEPVELTEIKSNSTDNWILKTFKRKQPSNGPLSRRDVTPIRIPVANKYAYLVGREENFDICGFEDTLTPSEAGKRKRTDQSDVGTPTRKKTRTGRLRQNKSQAASLSVTSTQINTNEPKRRQKRKNKKTRSQANSPSAADTSLRSESISPLTKKQRRSTFVPNETFKFFALICNFCGQDISGQKDHQLKHCKNINSGANLVKTRKSKNAIARCHDIGAAIDSKD